MKKYLNFLLIFSMVLVVGLGVLSAQKANAATTTTCTFPSTGKYDASSIPCSVVATCADPSIAINHVTGAKCPSYNPTVTSIPGKTCYDGLLFNQDTGVSTGESCPGSTVSADTSNNDTAEIGDNACAMGAVYNPVTGDKCAPVPADNVLTDNDGLYYLFCGKIGVIYDSTTGALCPPPTPVDSFSNSLAGYVASTLDPVKAGTTGRNVDITQNVLANLGLLNSNLLNANGQQLPVGPNTTKAISAFQKIAGLVVDGKMGPKTTSVMQAVIATTPALISNPISAGTGNKLIASQAISKAITTYPLGIPATNQNPSSGTSSGNNSSNNGSSSNSSPDNNSVGNNSSNTGSSSTSTPTITGKITCFTRSMTASSNQGEAYTYTIGTDAFFDGATNTSAYSYSSDPSVPKSSHVQYSYGNKSNRLVLTTNGYYVDFATVPLTILYSNGLVTVDKDSSKLVTFDQIVSVSSSLPSCTGPTVYLPAPPSPPPTPPTPPTPPSGGSGGSSGGSGGSSGGGSVSGGEGGNGSLTGEITTGGFDPHVSGNGQTVVDCTTPVGIPCHRISGNPRWADPMNIKIVNHLRTDRQLILQKIVANWNMSKTAHVTIVSGDPNVDVSTDCNISSGNEEVDVCEFNEGNVGWVGVASLATAPGQMYGANVIMNSYYLRPGSGNTKYETDDWYQDVLCQEVGHALAMSHNDQVFGNPNSHSCMDYGETNTDNLEPNARDIYLQDQIINNSSVTQTNPNFQSINAVTSTINSILSDPSKKIDFSKRSTWGIPTDTATLNKVGKSATYLTHYSETIGKTNIGQPIVRTLHTFPAEF